MSTLSSDRAGDTSLSDDSEGGHPIIDAIERRARSLSAAGSDHRRERSVSPAPKKRKKRSAAAVDASPIAALDIGDSSGDSGGRAKRRRRSSSNAAAAPAAGANAATTTPAAASSARRVAPGTGTPALAPVGVRVLAEGEEDTRNQAMQELLRQPRYFDDVYVERSAVMCWKCGKRGHLSKDCANPKERPCYLCAQYGHEASECPNSLCFQCWRPGHRVAECTSSVAHNGKRATCMRCGRTDCGAAGRGDYYRYEGGCDSNYSKADLREVRCLVCGVTGHLCCKESPPELPAPSCSNCGATGHTAEECPEELTIMLAGERRKDQNAFMRQAYSNAYGGMGNMYSGTYAGGAAGGSSGGYGSGGGGGRYGGRAGGYGGGGYSSGGGTGYSEGEYGGYGAGGAGYGGGQRRAGGGGGYSSGTGGGSGGGGGRSNGYNSGDGGYGGGSGGDRWQPASRQQQQQQGQQQQGGYQNERYDAGGQAHKRARR